jgi:mannitol/fructose-specific phosphotransferase system IIA component (Ntr-type)
MNLSEAVEKKAVLLDCAAADKTELLNTLIDAAGRSRRLKDVEAAREAIFEREELSSTGMGHGVAMPHARLKDVQFPVLGFARHAAGVDFDAVDGQPVKLVFLLLTPSSNPELNVQLLGKLSRMCSDADNRRRLARIDKVRDFMALIHEIDAANGFPD